MNTEERFEWIEKYLLDELSVAERQTYEAQLKMDPQLEEELNLQRSIIEAHSEKEVMAFREMVEDIQQQYLHGKSGRSSRGIIIPFRTILTIAAAVVLIGVIGIYLYLQSDFPTNRDQLFASYFDKDALSLTLDKSSLNSRDTSTAVINTLEENFANWKEAIRLYKDQQYDEALATLEKVDEAALRQDSSKYYFHLGLLCLVNNDLPKALKYLQKKGTYSESKRTWYYCLALLKSGASQNDLKEALLPIANSSTHPYRKEAIALTSSLNINVENRKGGE